MRRSHPRVMGYEVAGEVESARGGRLSAGQRVIAATRFNGFAELATADATDVLPLPEA